MQLWNMPFKRSGFLLALVATGLELMASPVSAEEDEQDQAAAPPQVSYVPINPSIITNIHAPGSRMRFLRADVSVRVKGSSTAQAISHHKPQIQHHLISLISEQRLEEVDEREDVNELRRQASERIKQVLAQEGAPNEEVEVLFTNFLIE